jgi:hypothetical protein
MKILGCLLKIGNCMNAGNKSRGQADGYMLDALGKTQTIKDNDGKSMLQLICKKLVEEDPEFITFKTNFKDCYYNLKVVFEDVKKECQKAKKTLEINKGQYDNIAKLDPDIEDVIFGK